MHPNTVALLKYFKHDQIEDLRELEIARAFYDLSVHMAARLDGPELTAGLRRLLESRDCMMRAAVTMVDNPAVKMDGPNF